MEAEIGWSNHVSHCCCCLSSCIAAFCSFCVLSFKGIDPNKWYQSLFSGISTPTVCFPLRIAMGKSRFEGSNGGGGDGDGANGRGGDGDGGYGGGDGGGGDGGGDGGTYVVAVGGGGG